MKTNLNKCWKLIGGGLAASTLLATSVIAPLTTKHIQNTKQNQQDQISVNTSLNVKSSSNANTLSEVTNDTIGAQQLFKNTNIPNITIDYSVIDSSSIIIEHAEGSIDATNQNLTMIDSIGGVPITAIGNNAFYYEYGYDIKCTSLAFGNNLTTIGSKAFMGCTISNIFLPSSLSSMGLWGFGDCGLKEIHYPNEETTGSGMTTKTWTVGSTTWVARSFWNSNNQLIGRMIEESDAIYTPIAALVTGNIDLSSSKVTTISEYQFAYCAGLTNVTFGNNLTGIKTGAFMQCTFLSDVTLPDSLLSIEQYAFANCSNITSISFPGSVTSIRSFVLGMADGFTSKLQSITFNWTNPASMACIDNNWLMGQSDYTPVSTFYVPKDSLDEYNAYVADAETCPEWWKTGSTKHFEAIPEPVPPGPSPTDTTLNLGIALGVSLGTCVGIPGIIGLGFLGKYKSEEKKQKNKND